MHLLTELLLTIWVYQKSVQDGFLACFQNSTKNRELTLQFQQFVDDEQDGLSVQIGAGDKTWIHHWTAEYGVEKKEQSSTEIKFV